MNKRFLDPKQPLHTCKEENCDGCHVSESLVCHFNGKQLGLFLALFFPLFIFGGYGLFTWKIWVFIAWLVFIPSFFGLIEIRVLCSHCPHYAEPELSSLKCWANYGSPKIWKYRPGPMNFLEILIFFLGFVLLMIPPALAYGLTQRWWLMGIYLALLVIAFLCLHLFYCKRCINFVCPLNAVKKNERDKFLEKNQVNYKL